ncbi:MAG: zinc-ribbon domain-containing protein [Nitrospirae bacterium]|nr:zinc-ribbon domain-containing protein [Nitrospirota bacterium]
MDIQCARCGARYKLDDRRITRDFIRVKCTNCGNVFAAQKMVERIIESPRERGRSENIREQVIAGRREQPAPARAGSGPGVADYIPGIIVMFLLTLGAIYLGKFLKGVDPNLMDRYHLNYVLFLLVIGIAWRNTIGIPDSLMYGIGLGRPLLKIGIIIMGLRFGLGALADIGFTGLAIIALFVFGSAGLILFLGKKFEMADSFAGVLASAIGICGVSAAIAAAPVVKARDTEIAYSIVTIILWGLIFLFAFPYIGSALGLTQYQFGAWAGTGILNSGQVIASASIYGKEARDIATLYNIIRVIGIPFVVLFIAFWYVGREASGEKVAAGEIIFSKFPIFVIGFFVLVVVRSFGFVKDADYKLMDPIVNWFFAFGFVAIGCNTLLSDLKIAGGGAFWAGSIAAIIKAFASLILIMIFL